MGVETVARRYAGALADIVVSSGNREEVTNELNIWQELISSSPELNNAFANPSIAHESKEKVLERLLERSRPSEVTSNFLRVLLRNSRLVNLPAINKKLFEVLEERSGRETGSVTSARELTGEEKLEFKKQLSKVTGKDVQLTFMIDESIIGGAVSRVGSTIYDGSVKSRLDVYRERMIKN